MLAAVAAVSALLFRRRSLGTGMRMLLSMAAVTMLGYRLIRDNGYSGGSIALTAAAACILGYGIWILRQAEQQRPPAE